MGRDPEYLAFLKAASAAMAPGASLEEERARIEDAMARVPLRDVGWVENVEVGRLYLPDRARPMPGMVFFHGGAWSMGSVASWDPVVRDVVAASGVAMLSVEYRLAPEHPYPAGLDDATAATAWAFENAHDLGLDPARLGVGGDSSGANFAAAVALRARDAGDPSLAAQLLVYGTYDMTVIPQRPPDPDGLIWPDDDRAGVYARYLGGADPRSAGVSPLLAAVHEGLPPAVVAVAEYDRLRPQGLAYAQRLRDAGVPVALLDCGGLDHGFLGWGSFARRPREAIAEIGAALGAVLGTVSA